MKTTRLRENGKITIPESIRNNLGWKGGIELEFVNTEQGLRVVESSQSPENILKVMNEESWTGPTSAELMAETRTEKLTS